jgi:hypothetical protein
METGYVAAGMQQVTKKAMSRFPKDFEDFDLKTAISTNVYRCAGPGAGLNEVNELNRQMGWRAGQGKVLCAHLRHQR